MFRPPPGVWIVVVFALGAMSGACSQYRQNAYGVTPANSLPGPDSLPDSVASEVCTDFSRGCGRTVWSLGWGLTHARAPGPAMCGDVGLAEVTVRDQPHYLLLTVITLGLVSPKRVEWKCASPDPIPGDFPGGSGSAPPEGG